MRYFAWIVAAALGLFLALHVVNALRLDAAGLNRSARALIERAEAVSSRAIPEYQDLTLARLPPNPNNGKFYRFDDNLHAAKISGKPPDSALEPGNEFQFRLEFDGAGGPKLISADGRSHMNQAGGLLVVTHHLGDYLSTEEPLDIPLAQVADFVMRARADKGNRFKIAWAAKGREAKLGEQEFSLDLIADGEFHTYVVDARNAFAYGVGDDESISRLAIAPSNADGARVEIDYIRVVSRQWKYQLEQAGTSHETVDSELRPVVHMIPGQALEYSIEIPEKSPELSFGAAALFDAPALRLAVSVSTDKGSTTVFEAANANARQWQDQRIDLGRWAGQAVRIAFSVQGSGSNVAFWSNPIVRSAVERRLNVILILEDALRADHLSTHGYRRETSPWRTKFMGEGGAVFLNAHSQAEKTRPSVPALMTSLYPTATGVLNFSDTLSDRYLTLAEILRAQGYVTAAFLQNGNAGTYAGLHQGMSSLLDPQTVGGATEKVFGERLLEWIDENSDRNFFAYVHALDPHGEYDPPAPFDRWYREEPAESMVGKEALPRSESLDPAWAKTPSAEARRRLYDGEILHNDGVMAQFVEELRTRNLLDDTVLVFVADHGEWLGELGRWEHGPPGLRPVIHVPLMIFYPKRFPEPKRIDESVQLIDVMPTILELASVDRSELLMLGDSLVGLIDGGDPERWSERITVSEEAMLMTREDTCACGSLFYGEWQLHGSSWGWPGRITLPFVKTAVYRFRKDGVRPVASFLPDLYVRQLRQKTLASLASANLATWRKLTEGEQRDVYKMDPETLERLRGLGYVN
ncbi:MAG TPA: sulfatase-like hydrolase/transferase [Steroidobacteraceae bacterium]